MNFRKSQDYAVTLTLHPRLFKESLEMQYDQALIEINKLNDKSLYHLSMTLVTELTLSYNIHIHGIISIGSNSNDQFPKDCLRYLNDHFRRSKIFGYRLIKAIDNEPKWFQYITKDLLKTKNALLCRCPILIDSDQKIDITTLNFPDFETWKEV